MMRFFIKQNKVMTGRRSLIDDSSALMKAVEIDEEIIRKFSGKLLLRQEIPLDDSLFKQYVANAYFTPALSIKKHFIRHVCQRCWQVVTAKINCSRCQQTHNYCRNCIQMGRVLACEPLYTWTGPSPTWTRYHDPLSWSGKLARTQQAASNQIVKKIKTGGEMAIWAVTGSGKTEMLFHSVAKALQLGKRICIATPRSDVVRELLPRFRQAFSHVEIEGLYGGSETKIGSAQLIIATTHQLLRYQAAFDVMIIDEVDAFPFHNDRTLQFAAKRAVKQSATQIYVTATPREKLKYQINTKVMDHVFVPIRYHQHPLPIPTLYASYTIKKDLQQGTVPAAFIRWLKQRQHPHRQLLIFVPTIQSAIRMQQAITAILKEDKLIQTNKEVMSVHAEDNEREKKVSLFRQRQLYCLITTTILERGVTFPSIDVAVLDASHIVFDRAALVQITGRAGRSAQDPSGEVTFFHDGLTNAIVEARAELKMMNTERKQLLKGDR